MLLLLLLLLLLCCSAAAGAGAGARWHCCGRVAAKSDALLLTTATGMN
jgi:hypothetical protein